jgi:MFS family permease
MGVLGFAPHILIIVLYFESLLNSYALSSLVFSIMFLSTTVSEIPIGIFSDIIGRRKTMILGGFFNLFSVVFYLSASYAPLNPIYLLCVGSFCHGIGRALFSGTDEAIVYESSKYLGNKDFKKYFSRGRSFNGFSTGTSALLSGFIAYYFSYRACYMASIVSYIVLICVTFTFYEVPLKHKGAYNNSFMTHVKEAVSYFKKSSKLRKLGILNIIDDSVTGSLYRYEIMFVSFFIPEYLLGVFRLVRQYVIALSFAFSRKIISFFGRTEIILIANITNGSIRFAAFALNNIFSPILLSMNGALGGACITSISEQLQEEFTDEQRATMKSLITIFISFVEAIIIFILGILADYFSLRVSMMLILLIKILPISIAVSLIRDDKKTK